MVGKILLIDFILNHVVSFEEFNQLVVLSQRVQGRTLCLFSAGRALYNQTGLQMIFVPYAIV